MTPSYISTLKSHFIIIASIGHYAAALSDGSAIPTIRGYCVVGYADGNIFSDSFVLFNIKI